MSTEPKFFVAVKGLIFWERRFLIVKRSEMARGEANLWELPGGRLEFMETPEAALIREIKEEAGIDVSIIKLLSSWIFSREQNSQIVGLTFLCDSQCGNIQLSREHKEYAWIYPEEIMNYQFIPVVLNDLKQYDWNEIQQDIKKRF